MHIAEIKATDKISEVWELLSLHRDELATHKNLMLLKPDVERYRQLENTNNLVTLALYNGDKIVGYSVNIISNNLHYSDLVYVINDIIFVHPDYRGGVWGVKLITETENIARVRGAALMMFHGKKDTKFHSLMPRLGYAVQDIIFSKEL